MARRTTRVKIVTGLKCNVRCVFCYYQDNLKSPNRPRTAIVQDLRIARRAGITAVDFSGGEPTLHPDLPWLIATAKELGIATAAIISNGWRLADRKYVEELKQAGLDEVLLSVHGPDEATHDALTGVAGSFARMAQALDNVAAAGLVVRSNTVVNRINLGRLSAYAKFIVAYRPVQVNFITINDWCFAKNLVDRYMLRYSEMAPALRAVCASLSPSVAWVNVRYIPHCFMQGYERFVCNHRQVPYDPYEWVPRVRARLEQQNHFLRYLGILGYGLVFGGAIKGLGRKPWTEVLDDAVVDGLRRWYYVKGPRCRACRYYAICDGVERTYAKLYALDELVPVPGETVRDPIAFRHGLGSDAR